uniref:VCBS domain-containing protein n=1 Tax=Vibrio tasmaniensis TaxID=212663 RepID=UPI001119D57C
VTVTDNHTETVTVTITGTNDAPVLTVETEGTLTEGTKLTDSGALSFTDVDTSDTHTVTESAATTVWSGGSLTSAQTAALQAGFSVSNSGWDYTIGNSAVDFLAQGETVTLTYDVTVT